MLAAQGWCCSNDCTRQNYPAVNGQRPGIFRNSPATTAFILGALLFCLGLGLAYAIHTQNGRTVIEDVRFSTGSGQSLSGLLYIPAGVSAQQPAPAILAVHGYINSRETQSGFAIEFARRGYVVLSLDQSGHGFSEPPAFAAGFGAPAALAYLRDLAITDNDNIGLEGHSMGGWAVLAAAAAAPADYRAMVIVGSATGVFGAPEGTAEFPRNLAVVFSRYDEFSELMWGVKRARDVTESVALQKLFNTTSAVQANRLYGQFENGTARILNTPAVTHAGDHLSHSAIGFTLDWFQRTLQGGAALPGTDQLWLGKELGTLLALIGFITMLAAGSMLLISTPLFSALVMRATLRQQRLGWRGACTIMLLPIVTYIPLFLLADKIIPISSILPQQLNNGLLLWLVGNTAISLFLMAFAGNRITATAATPPRPVHGQLGNLLLSAGFAVLLVAGGYLLVQLTALVLNLDLRFWVFAIKPLATWHYPAFFAYLLPVLVYFLVLCVTLLQRHSPAASLPASIGKYASLLCGGFLAFLSFQYVGLCMLGRLPLGQPLLTILAIQFLLMLAIAAVLLAVLLRVTRQIYPAAFTCALLITWVVVAGQATHA